MTNNVEILFQKHAERLLNNVVLKVKDVAYRICEIEMYYCGKDHEDKYTHCDSLQLENETFYPHRFKTGTYKSGTYKCMDIAYGNKETMTYFGILIRSLKRLDDNIFFTGPCICVNELLRHFDCTEFKDFFKNYTTDEFKLEEQKLDYEDIFVGPRVGLGDKYPEFKDKKYRFATHIKQIKKQKIFEKLHHAKT